MASSRSSGISWDCDHALPFLPDLIVRSQRVLTPGGIRPAAVHVRGGKIAGVVDFDDVPAGCPLDEAGAAAVIPGVVDTCVHVDAAAGAGRRSFEATTRAAAAGGITTLILAPLDNMPDPLNASRAAALTTGAGVTATLNGVEGHCYVDVGVWGGIVPGNTGEAARMVDAGVFGFACSLAPCSVDAVSEADLRVAMPAITRLGVPLLVHAESPGPITRAAERRRAGGPLARLLTSRRSRRYYSAYLASRPKEAENEAIALMVALCQEFRTRIHIVPLSSSDALTPLFHARSARLPITAATSPHYLTFVAEEIPDGATSFKCAPPIRERENREFLWASLAGGLIQMTASDHSAPPDAVETRSADFRQAWSGIPSLEISLSAMWTGAVARGYTLNQVTEWMCKRPARLAGLDRKGAIEPGYNADLVVIDPDAAFTVSADQSPSHEATPYRGRRLHGVVERTYLRGRRIFERGQPIEGRYGRVLTARS
jgi:allantoinase